MPTEYLRPDSDVSAGSWTSSAGGALWSVLDDVPDDDGTFASASGTAMEVGLSNLSGTGVVSATIKARIQSANTGTAPMFPLIELREGATVRASFQPSQLGIGTYTLVSYALSSGERAAITNWANLAIRVTAQWDEGSLDGGTVQRFSELWLEVVTTSGGAAARVNLPLLGVGYVE